MPDAPSDPVPDSRVQITVAPPTPLPNWSLTRTTSGNGSERPTESTCASPETMLSCAGVEGVAVSVTVTGASEPEAASN